MNRYLPVIIALILLVSGSNAAAREQGRVGFNYFNSGYQFNNSVQEGMLIKEIRGSYQLADDLSVAAGYNFGQYDNYVQGDLKQFSLGLNKEFSRGTNKLAVGLIGSYSNFNTKLLSQEMFQVTGKNLELTAGVEKELTEQFNLFADASYGLAGDYQLGTKLLNLGQLTDYQTDSNYQLQSGVKWEVVPDIEVKLGYMLAQERIKNKSFSDLTIRGYDLTEINKFTRSIFFGLDSKF